MAAPSSGFSGHVPSETGVPPEAVSPPARRPFAAVFRALISLAAITGIVINLCLASPLRVLSYFTIQSNLIVAAVFALSAWRAWKGRAPLPPWVTTGTVLFISITGLVYHLLLANASSDFSMTDQVGPMTGWRGVSNELLHTVTPLAAAVDWLFLTRPGGLRLRHAGLWLLYPLAYLAFCLLRGALMSPGSEARYPYPFVDVEQHGYAGVLGNAVVLGLCFYALALAFVGLDRIRPAPGPRKNRISSPGAGPLK
ncbi:Pr6Pr family membrane protein [Streptomyces sp. TRM66268-LWL]|uniref:Pr6Pr family membrane protein n=1 Tax=Streptomyces polyasparticus TaxID=2767826 RepID=A0ABR7SJZ3_9ACTN|nr:Pr6Pr family membrane protein [Streptomyces polyasparticus]MBC9714643.1 Pr6Pr family membrane protein [Streptomyces polyasparticus]